MQEHGIIIQHFTHMNPFSNFGAIVYGERFIGREDSLRAIEDRILGNREPASISIVGLPRVGKSSLAYEACIARKERYLTKKYLPIWFDCGSLKNGVEMFLKLVCEAADQLTEIGIDDTILEQRKLEVQEACSQTWGEMTRAVTKYFKRVRALGWHLIYILDEFDRTRTIFSEDGHGFHFLRELAYLPETKITYVATCRRSIKEIQGQTPISNLDNIFRNESLALYSCYDCEMFFSRLNACLSEEIFDLENIVKYFAGAHPYLLDLTGAHVLELIATKVAVTKASLMPRINAPLVDFYEGQVMPLIREEGRLQHLIDLLFGAALDVPKVSEEALIRSGLVSQELLSFSEHFGEYLRLIERERDVWPLWKTAECALRDLIERVLTEQLGATWVEGLEKSRKHLAPILTGCRERRAREQATFGARASTRLLEFAYPDDLFAILFSEWSSFKIYLGHDKNYWSLRKELFVRVRNPLAHNRGDILAEYERVLFSGYCSEVVERCRSVSDKNNH